MIWICLVLTISRIENPLIDIDENSLVFLILHESISILESKFNIYYGLDEELWIDLITFQCQIMK